MLKSLKVIGAEALIVLSLLSTTMVKTSVVAASAAETVTPYLANAPSRLLSGEQRANSSFLYRDIYLQEEPGLLTFGNSKISLQVNSFTGEWASLTAEGIPGSLVTPINLAGAIDFRIDGVWMIEQHGATLLKHQVEIDRMRNGVSLRLIFGVSPRSGGAEQPRQEADNATPLPDEAPLASTPLKHPFEYEVTCSYTLFPAEGRLERSAKLARNTARNTLGNSSSPSSRSHSTNARRMEGFLFGLPGAVIGDSTECVVNAPGPFFPRSFVKPNTPYDTLKDRTINFHSAPDAGFGLLAVSNERRNMTLASWMDTSGEVAYRSALHSDGKRISFRHHNLREYRLTEGLAVDSDVHRIEVTAGPLAAALAKYRQMVAATMPLDTKTPGWVREMILLEVFPEYFPDGFKGITRKLPFYREVGFNTLYLMPHWLGGYSPIDLFKVDSSLGTVEDLQETVRTAHRLGMKVLFDMVIHGFNEKSPVTSERPDIFVHTEQGALARHPTWKSITTDWAHPAYQQYMVDVVRHDLKTYDIDGYRVDAATFKGASWDSKLPYPAYRSGSAAPELMRLMLDALRQHKPDAVLLSEVFGPAFYSVSNLVHDNQTEAPQLVLEKMETKEVTAADYKRHIANVLDMLPANANRVFFARNHDTSWFYHFNGYTQRFMAMDAVHALFGIPEVFAGDPKPKNGPSPDADPAVYDYYRKLFGVRKSFPEVARGEVLLRDTECDNDSVFTGLRRLNGQLALVVVSLSDKSEQAKIHIHTRADPPFDPLSPTAAATVSAVAPRKVSLMLRDAITGETVKATRTATAKLGSVSVQLKPFQVLVGRL